MRATRRRDLLAGAALAAVIGYVVVLATYRYFPPVTLWAGVSLAGLAVVEAGWGELVRRRIADGRVGVGGGRLHPLAVARSVSIAKASAWVGALVFGWWAAVWVYLMGRRELSVAVQDIPGAAVAAASALALAVAALWLQHCCTSPQDR